VMSFNLNEQEYNIEDELKVRRILEEQTEWNYEFTKNSKYAPDLQLHNWGPTPERPDDRNLTGLMEIEVTSEKSDWQSGDIPDSFTTINFLKRKIRVYDYKKQMWCDVKTGFRNTLYLKFNHQLDNCFVAPVERIYHDGSPFKWKGGGPNWEFYRLHPDHDSITYGIHDSVRFIEEYFDRLDNEQTSLSNFASIK